MGSPLRLFDNSAQNLPGGMYQLSLIGLGTDILPTGGSTLAATGNRTAPYGIFGTDSISYQSPLLDDGIQHIIGAPLRVVLQGSAGAPTEVDFDKVNLTGTPISGPGNEFVPPPDPSFGFSMVFRGDVTAALAPILHTLSTDATLNPFVYLGFGSSVSATLNGDGNTDLHFVGSSPITNTDVFCYGGAGAPCNHMPHFGFDGLLNPCFGETCSTLQIIDQFWTDEPTVTFPSLTFGGPPLTGPTVAWEIVFADVTRGGTTIGQWFEMPYTTDHSPIFSFTNNTAAPELLSNVGFFLSPTEIPLDDLNFGTDSPPDIPGSPFTGLAQLDGLDLSSGGSVTVSPVPEPSTLPILGVAVVAILWSCRRRRA